MYVLLKRDYMDFKPTDYKLLTVATNRIFEDTGWVLNDPQCAVPSLVRAIYDKKQIEFKDESYGFYKYADWLPVNTVLKNSSAPVTYKSEKLAKHLGLEKLYIPFSGYWPEKGAAMNTCSFKETEAYSVCARLPLGNEKILVLASAGTTARAVAQVCSDNNIPIVIAIPYENINAMWFKKPLNDCVKIISTPAKTDYYDAIQLAAKVCGSDKFIEEGGAKNIARRDGMGTTVLSAAEFIGSIPEFYFQAIGSGTGTIAAWEANMRLIEDGRFGKNLMKLIPSQNIPFTPMYDAWQAGSKELLPCDQDKARIQALEIVAKVLSNRKPPYSIAGGLYDALKASNGDVEIATNAELQNACELFKELEGNDIHHAAGVAVSSLIKAVKKGTVKKDSLIMLNITGGGEQLFKKENKCVQVKPDLIISDTEESDRIIEKVLRLFNK